MDTSGAHSFRKKPSSNDWKAQIKKLNIWVRRLIWIVSSMLKERMRRNKDEKGPLCSLKMPGKVSEQNQTS